MSVYKNDKPEFVRVAFDSMLVEQSIKPSEILLVRDGKVSEELEDLLCKYETQFPNIFRIIRLKQNEGLGKALELGVRFAKNEIVARMDSDDICLSKRFEKQLIYLEQHPECDIVGGTISEFIGTPDNIVGSRICPLTNKDIKNYMKSRCGLNHVTVMFRKSGVLRAGNYQDWFWNEDYYLWIRMILVGCQFANLPETLVNVRVGKDMYARRGGWKYFKSEAKLQHYMWKNHVIGFIRFIYNVSIRFAVQVAMPNTLRGWVFRMFARN